MDPQVLKFCATIRTCVGPNRSFCLGNFFRRHRSFFCFLGWYIFFSCIFWLNYLDQITTYSQSRPYRHRVFRLAVYPSSQLFISKRVADLVVGWPRVMGWHIWLRHTACSPEDFAHASLYQEMWHVRSLFSACTFELVNCAQELRGNFEFYKQAMRAYIAFSFYAHAS